MGGTTGNCVRSASREARFASPFGPTRGPVTIRVSGLGLPSGFSQSAWDDFWARVRAAKQDANGQYDAATLDLLNQAAAIENQAQQAAITAWKQAQGPMENAALDLARQFITVIAASVAGVPPEQVTAQQIQGVGFAWPIGKDDPHVAGILAASGYPGDPLAYMDPDVYAHYFAPNPAPPQPPRLDPANVGFSRDYQQDYSLALQRLANLRISSAVATPVQTVDNPSPEPVRYLPPPPSSAPPPPSSPYDPSMQTITLTTPWGEVITWQGTLPTLSDGTPDWAKVDPEGYAAFQEAMRTVATATSPTSTPPTPTASVTIPNDLKKYYPGAVDRSTFELVINTYINAVRHFAGALDSLQDLAGFTPGGALSTNNGRAMARTALVLYFKATGEAPSHDLAVFLGLADAGTRTPPTTPPPSGSTGRPPADLPPDATSSDPSGVAPASPPMLAGFSGSGMLIAGGIALAALALGGSSQSRSRSRRK